MHTYIHTHTHRQERIRVDAECEKRGEYANDPTFRKGTNRKAAAVSALDTEIDANEGLTKAEGEELTVCVYVRRERVCVCV